MSKTTPRARLFICALTVVGAALIVAPARAQEPPPAPNDEMILVSRADGVGGAKGNHESSNAHTSFPANGPRAAFTSLATNLYSDDTGASNDTHLLRAGTADRVGRTWPSRSDLNGVHPRVELDNSRSIYPVVNDPGPWIEAAKLAPSDGAIGDLVGYSVDIFGDTALVGAPGDAVDGNAFQGAAYVFIRSDGEWNEQAKLVASDGAADDQFGVRVAVWGDTALVGAFFADSFRGAAYVFVRNGNTWSEQAKLVASDGEMGDGFGDAVALSGDTALIGAAGFNGLQGAAYVFTRSNGEWSEQTKLLASDGVPGDEFGRESVALSGDTALVGAQRNEGQGAAYVFTRAGGVWSEQAKLTASVAEPELRFGWSVALAGDTAMVGAPGDVNRVNRNTVYVFSRSEGEWTEEDKITVDGGNRHLGFDGISLSGDTALLGSSYAPAGGCKQQGKAYVFVRSGGVWNQEAELTASDGGPEDCRFGWSTAISDTIALVGNPLAPPDPSALQGAAYVFARTDETIKLDVTPDLLDFGKVPIGETSDPETLTLVSTGTAAVTISGITQPGAPFTSTGGSCGEVPFTLAPKASCTLDFTFNPTAEGSVETTVTITSNADSSPHTATLQGVGIGGGAAHLTFEPTDLDFGEVGVGSTGGPLNTMLQNTGNVDLTGIAFDLQGDGFAVDTSACGTTLGVGASCAVGVTFSPMEPGPATAILAATSDQDASAGLGLAGTGTSDGVVTPVGLEVDPEGLLSDGNRVLEPGELVDVAPAWRNDDLFGTSLTGTATGLDGPDGAPYLLPLDHADYGNLESGATASCLDTGVCYWMGVGDPAVRPAPHWSATFDETLSDNTAHTWSLHIGDSFADVPRESPFYTAVEILLHHDVTGGCTDTEYCPAGTNTRGQMAVFLLKAVEDGDYAPPACVEDEERFADVPFDSPLCPWIEELAERGVTTGCGGGNYCPASAVTRAQMAVFLLRAFEGDSYAPPECSGVFSDVDCPSTFADWVEELAARGVTGGCSAEPPAYCPAEPVTRAQMASFVTQTFGLALYGP